MQKILIAITVLFLTACAGDPNDLPRYGSESYLPANCRAYVQESVEQYRSGAYSADETIDALERNCGLHGQLWSYEP